MSIAIINHNYARFLVQAIDSALAQDYRPIEVIVVDDGSTDESRSIIARYGEHVMALLQDNLGHVEAVNLAISASRGEVLLFLDADDMLYPHCLATAMAVWDGSLSKLQFRLDTVDATGADQLMPFPALTSDLTSAEILRRVVATGYYPWPVSSGNLYARAYLAHVAPIPSSRIFKSPDGYLNKLAPLFGAVHSLPVCLGAYRVHGDNAWAQTNAAINAERYARMVRFDATLHAEFVAVASRMGIAVPDYDRAAVPQMLEARLLSLRLWPGAHPIAGDRRSRLLWLALRCACRAQGRAPASGVSSGPCGWSRWRRCRRR